MSELSTPNVDADAASAEQSARRRRIRSTALRLALFAVVVYVGFIIAFINRH